MPAGPITALNRSIYFLGNPSKEEAHTYFFQNLLPTYPLAAPGVEEAWDRVYEVCGGNPGLLRIVASNQALSMDWNNGEYTLSGWGVGQDAESDDN